VGSAVQSTTPCFGNLGYREVNQTSPGITGLALSDQPLVHSLRGISGRGQNFGKFQFASLTIEYHKVRERTADIAPQSKHCIAHLILVFPLRTFTH
jgi:hypothetical protein